MRISSRMMSDTVLRNILSNTQRLTDLQGQITSGKVLNRPSDDPAGMQRALQYRAAMAMNDQNLQSIDGSLAWMNATDSSLAAAGESLQRARELAVQGGQSQLTLDQQTTIAAELDQILKQLVGAGNSSLRGQRLFGGSRIDIDPFTEGGPMPSTVTYNGDNRIISREIEAGITVPINVDGNAAFQPAFAAVVKVRDALRNGDAATASAGIADIDGAIDTMLNVRADLGARVNRLEATRDRLNSTNVSLSSLLSNVEDTDFAKAISEYTLQETVYRASLQSGARALQPSLMDYMR